MNEVNEVVDDDSMKGQPLKVLFLSSDTGGGHRASAESLANQFKILYPGTTYDLLDVFADGGVPPYNTLVESYKHLSAHPSQWNLVYKFTNSRAMEVIFDKHSKLMCERAIRNSILALNPDVVVSVHPMMTNVPVLSCANISEETGRHLPIFTVVTDLGSAHSAWFANGVDKMFIASDQIRELAKTRGKLPDNKLVQIGLPIRHQFAVQADLLGDRMSDAGKAYQQKLRLNLGLPYANRKTIMVMGGGEGVGSLSNIVDALYYTCVVKGIDAVILVVCGRNETLKNDLETKDWDSVVAQFAIMKRSKPRKLSQLAFSNCTVTSNTDLESGNGTKQIASGCMEGIMTNKLRKILSSSSLTRQNAMNTSPLPSKTISDETSLNEKQQQDDNGVEQQASGCLEGSVTNTLLRILSTSSLTRQNVINKSVLVDVNTSRGDSVTKCKEKETSMYKKQDKPQIDRDRETIEKESTELHFSDVRVLEDADHPIYQLTSEDELHSDTSEDESCVSTEQKGCVAVVGLGFITTMAEYMAVADVLVSKAGPGTIAEAAAVSLPVMLTSFLPGQEEGNVDFVVDGKFGVYIPDTHPSDIAREVTKWLVDDNKMRELSDAAKSHGAPNAARDIVKDIGNLALQWKKINDDRDTLNKAADALRLGIP